LKGFHIAVVGATGLVGQECIKVLEQRQFPMASIELLASDRSAGRKLFVNHQEMEVKETTSASFERIDIAFFSAGTEVSQYFSPIAARAGAVVIDNSAAFRTDPRVPLIVPEVNPHEIRGHRGIIANPDSTTIQLVVALYPLHRINPIKRIIVDTYQAVSGTGAAAMEELSSQTRLVLEGRGVVPHVYPHQIAFNVLPEVDVFLDNGYSRGEWRLAQETRRILHAEDMAISATCVRVPIYIGNSLAIHAEFTSPMPADEARRILAEAPGVKLLDEPNVSLYPHPWSVAGQDIVFVGRIRQDNSYPNSLALWVVADNLRKGAALNAVQIAERLIEGGYI
jgi:aspartate-semialdehyde dehydrogenase